MFNSNNKDFIFNNGEVGIGTINPTRTLDVDGTMRVREIAKFDDKVGIGTDYPDYSLEVNGDIQINSNSYLLGNVGIGTTSPTHTLEVIGDMQVSSDSYLMGNVGVGTNNPDYNLHIFNSGGTFCIQNSDQISTDGETFSSLSLGSDFNPDLVKMSANYVQDYFGSIGTRFVISTTNSSGILEERFSINEFGLMNFFEDVTFNSTIDVTEMAWFKNKVKIGIGGTVDAKLHVKSDTEHGLIVETNHDYSYGYGIRSIVNNGLTKAIAINNSGEETFMVYGNGKTYIDNILYAKEIEVRTPVWGDYVFDKDYKINHLKKLFHYFHKLV